MNSEVHWIAYAHPALTLLVTLLSLLATLTMRNLRAEIEARIDRVAATVQELRSNLELKISISHVETREMVQSAVGLALKEIASSYVPRSECLLREQQVLDRFEAVGRRRDER